jgi:hypothetical protein
MGSGEILVFLRPFSCFNWQGIQLLHCHFRLSPPTPKPPKTAANALTGKCATESLLKWTKTVSSSHFYNHFIFYTSQLTVPPASSSNLFLYHFTSPPRATASVPSIEREGLASNFMGKGEMLPLL